MLALSANGKMSKTSMKISFGMNRPPKAALGPVLTRLAGAVPSSSSFRFRALVTAMKSRSGPDFEVQQMSAAGEIMIMYRYRGIVQDLNQITEPG